MRNKPFISISLSHFQGSFIPGRQLTDSILEAHEAFHTNKETKIRNGLMGIKIGFEKAYDKVNWDFIYYILQSLYSRSLAHFS